MSNAMDDLQKWTEAELKKAEASGQYTGLFTGNPQGPGFVMGDYTREQALASVGMGWAKLVGALWDYCKSFDPPIEVHQVKEKYGELCFYVGGVPDDKADMTYAIIDSVESRSHHVCEICGEPGKLRGPGWYFTACSEHARGKKPVDGQAGAGR